MPFISFEEMMNNLVPPIGIDLGTSNTPIYIRGKGVVFSEPSYVARNNQTGKVIAVGEMAKKMYGRTPLGISVIRPLRDGIIANFEIALEMMKHLLNKASQGRILLKPSLIVGIPSDCTPVERRGVEEAAMAAGGRQVVLVMQPLLAALGAGLPVKEPVGSMMVDIGGGTTEIAIIALGGIVSSQSLRIAGDEMDEAITSYVKKNYNLIIGERTAETVKIQSGSAYPNPQEKNVEVRGRDVFSGLPRTQTISSSDIREAIIEPVVAIIEGVRASMEHAPPELVGDIIEHGITISGGGSLLEGLDLLIQESLGVPCHRAANPVYSVALGTGLLFEDSAFLKQIANRRQSSWKQTAEVA